MSEPEPPNRDQAALWNDASGRTWVEMQDVLDRMLAPFGALLIDEAFPGEGAPGADIGCGAGATTLAMARRLGPAGSAWAWTSPGRWWRRPRHARGARTRRTLPSSRPTRRPTRSSRALRRDHLAVRGDVLRRSRGGVRQHPARGAAAARR